MYGRIIVPIDGSDLSLQALAVATSLAEHSDAALVLVTVITSRGPSLGAETLAGIAATVDAPVIETRLLHDDDPGERLAAFIRSEPDALVCLSTHGRGRIRQTVLGSVAARIVRDGGRPVVMVGPNYEKTRPFVLERILVCLDGSSLSEAVIPTALAWAEEHDSSVLLAEVVPPIAEAATAEARIPRASTGPDSYLAKLAASLTGPAPVEWVVIADERAERGILQLATEHKASLIVMATHGETGLALVAVGSVATAVACSSPVPVLLVRPAMPAP